jgi:hypothetical protein
LQQHIHQPTSGRAALGFALLCRTSARKPKIDFYGCLSFWPQALQHILRCLLNLTRARASPFLQRGCAARPLVFGRMAGLR